MLVFVGADDYPAEWQAPVSAAIAVRKVW